MEWDIEFIFLTFMSVFGFSVGAITLYFSQKNQNHSKLAQKLKDGVENRRKLAEGGFFGEEPQAQGPHGKMMRSRKERLAELTRKQEQIREMTREPDERDGVKERLDSRRVD